MPKQTSPNPLADRLDALGIEPNELATIIRRPVEEVESWVAGDAEPDAEAGVLLRVLGDDHRAALAVERVRNMRVLPLRAGTGTAAGIEPPYGSGHQGATGGQPS